MRSAVTGTDNAPGRLEGRRVIITGAASGIGRATARLFAREGAHLALLDRDAVSLSGAAAESGGLALKADLLDEGQIRDAVAHAADRLNGLDGVVNVAGIGGAQRLEELTLDMWNTVMAVNLTAPALICREALECLRESSAFSTVVNVASGQGLLPSAPGLAAYAASKGGLVMLGRELALELAPIRVNTVCPGVVDTPLLPAGMAETAKGSSSPYALKRVGRVDEIARAILFLTSTESSFVTGTAMAVDGGRTYH